MSGGPVFFLSAAEHSGDALGAAVIPMLRRTYPNAVFVGVGGPRMAAAGCKLIADPVARSAMLMRAVITQARYWWRLLKRIRRELEGLKPAVVVPIDSSTVNLRVAKLAKGLGIPVCYYVAPQIWASRPWRVKKLRAVTDTVCCVLPFEEAYFKKQGVNAVYVGHPMFDAPADTPESDPLRVEPALPGVGDGLGAVTTVRRFATGGEAEDGGGGPRVAIFPGSRRGEVDANLPRMLAILEEVRGRYPRAAFVAAAPSEERAWQVRHYLRKTTVHLDIIVGMTDAIIRWADLCLAKSGTATLQIARHRKPMVVVYRVPGWQWHLIGKLLVNTRYIALVNILADREVVPEYVPFGGSPVGVARRVIELLNRPELREQMVRDLGEVVGTLMPVKEDGAVLLAAERVAREVSRLVRA